MVINVTSFPSLIIISYYYPFFLLFGPIFSVKGINENESLESFCFRIRQRDLYADSMHLHTHFAV